MKMKNIIRLLGVSGVLIVAGPAMAAGTGNGPGVGTNNFSHTNYYAYSNYYQNHYFYTNGTSEGWYTNMARWSNAPAPRQYKAQNGVVAPASASKVEPSGPRPNGPITPADVQALVQRFQQDREAFMTQKRALEQQMSGATERDRQRLRDQLKDQMEQCKQQQAQLREQLRDQCDRMGDQLRDHSRLMDRVSNPGTTSGGPVGQNAGGARGR